MRNQEALILNPTLGFWVAGCGEAHILQDVVGGLQPQNSLCAPSRWHGNSKPLVYITNYCIA